MGVCQTVERFSSKRDITRWVTSVVVCNDSYDSTLCRPPSTMSPTDDVNKQRSQTEWESLQRESRPPYIPLSTLMRTFWCLKALNRTAYDEVTVCYLVVNTLSTTKAVIGTNHSSHPITNPISLFITSLAWQQRAERNGSLAVSKAYKATFWPTPLFSFKELGRGGGTNCDNRQKT